MLRVLLFSCIGILINQTGVSQSGFFDEPIFRLSVYTHSIGLPFKDFVKRPLNFGISGSIGYAYNKDKANPLVQEFELSWFNHKHLNKAFMVKSNLSKSYFTDNDLNIDASFGIGYIIDLSENATYALQDNGKYGKSLDLKSGFTTQIGFGVGKRISREGKSDFAPFIRYEGMIQLPYSDFTPFLPHTMLHVGTKIFTSKNN